jgi:hypothetical protein
LGILADHHHHRVAHRLPVLQEIREGSGILN